MNPLFAQLAMDWLEAERLANPERWRDAPKRDDMTVAIDRVYQVITGNVLWSEASPGDKAVWKSRVEDIPAFGRTWRRKGKPIEPEQQEPDPYNQVTPRRPRPRNGRDTDRFRVWWNYYDTITVDAQGFRSAREDVERGGQSRAMFNNTHVGMPFYCNLQVGGQTIRDATFVVLHFYVAISSLEALHWAADRVLFRFDIGTRPATPTMFLRDLFRGIVLARPLIIPVRQNFGARVELKELPPAGLPPFDLVFHFEGLESRDIQ